MSNLFQLPLHKSISGKKWLNKHQILEVMLLYKGEGELSVIVNNAKNDYRIDFTNEEEALSFIESLAI